jgi:magnesium transporter
VTISARLYRDGQLADPDLDPSKVSDVLSERGAVVWVDVAHPTQEVMAALQEEFGFHELAIEDSLSPHQRPKAERYEGYYFLVCYLVEAVDELREDGDAGVVTRELAAFVCERYLVTIRKDEGIDLEQVAMQWEAHPDRLKEGGGAMLYWLLDAIVDGYFVAVDALEDRTEDLEEEILGSDEGGGVRGRIFSLRKELFHVRRAVAPLRDVLDSLQRRTLPVVTEDLEPYYRDVYDHVLRVTDYVDTLRDILSSMFDAHLSAVSNRLNETVKRLTSWAAIVAVPTLIASIYGMNFRHMPELYWRYGYLYALGLMGGLSFALYRFFKRRDWL